jgi:hypothetical protein
MKQIAICGDSFSVGIGCRDLINEPYGQLLGKHLKRPVVNLAKGSSTHLSILLQAKYVADVWKDNIEFCFVGNTGYDRVDWFPLKAEYNTQKDNPILSNLDVNYHQYPPYGEYTYITQLPNPMGNEPGYKGNMLTENIRGVIEYWENYIGKNRDCGHYYQKFVDEPNERIKTLYDYGINLMDIRITRMQSAALMTMAHNILNKAGIKHLIFSHEIDFYECSIDRKNLLYVDWGQLSLQYPDNLPSMHCNEIGQKIVYQDIINKLQENNWI